MTAEQIIKLLNKKTTTIEDILINLSDMVQAYQDEREDYYIQQLEEAMYSEEIATNSIDVDEQTKQILQLVSKDTKIFIKEYTNEITDHILDLINQRRVKKNPGFCFLTMLSAMKEAYDVS